MLARLPPVESTVDQPSFSCSLLFGQFGLVFLQCQVKAVHQMDDAILDKDQVPWPEPQARVGKGHRPRRSLRLDI